MKYKNSKKILFLTGLFMIISVLPIFSSGATEAPEIPPITSGPQYLSPNSDGVQDQATIDFSVKLYVKSDEGYIPEYGLKIKDKNDEIIAEEICKEKSDVFWLFQLFMGYSEFNLNKKISWDGTDKQGAKLPDGKYKVTLWVKDAKNQIKEVELEDFVVDTKKPEVIIKEPESLHFSPNNDGINDFFNITQTKGTIEKKWQGIFKDEAGNIVKTFVWEDSAPENVSWNGIGDNKNPVKNGKYSYEIQTTDLAGNKSDLKQVKNIELDAKAPIFRIKMDSQAFSPNGDNVKDTLAITPIYEKTDEITSWSWSISNSEKVVMTKKGNKEDLPKTVTLDGFNNSGLPIFPGTYLFSMSLTYNNDWNPVSEKEISIDIVPPRIEVTPDRTIFSPNGDGMGDTVSIKFQSNETVTWEGRIVNMKGDTILETDYTRTSSLIVWDGTTDAGDSLPDGEYLMIGVFSDLAGNVTYTEPLLIAIDRRSVTTKIEIPKGFSPNNDGVEDNLEVKVTADLYEDVDIWKLAIIDDTGATIKTISGKGTLPKTITWDGNMMQDEKNTTALEGVYQAVLYVNYIKGDMAKSQSDFFALDNDPPKIKMVVKSNSLAKTEKGLKGDVLISIDVEENRFVRGWMLDVYDENGELIRSFAGKGNPSGNITWNTSEQNEKISEDGKYTVSLKVIDEAGNNSEMNEKISLDVMLVKRKGKYFLAVPNIIFGAYEHTLDSAGPNREKANYESLKKVVELSERFPDYGLVLEAHALNIYLETDRQKSEEAILKPLTEKRAEEVKKALIELGMSPEKIKTSAFGGLQPMVSVRDRSVRWKNRRVEFAITGIK